MSARKGGEMGGRGGVHPRYQWKTSFTHQLAGEHAFKIAPLQNVDYYFLREDCERSAVGSLIWPWAHNSGGYHFGRAIGRERVAEGDHGHGGHYV